MRSLLLPVAGLALVLPSGLGGAELGEASSKVRGAMAQLIEAAAPAGEALRLAATTLQAPGIATEARRTRQPARTLGAPTFSRIEIAPHGESTFEGDGAPGSRVTVSIGGRAIGTQVVGPLGRWRVSLDRPLPAGDHHIEATARYESRAEVLIGDEVRIAIPQSFSGNAIVAFDAERDGPAQRPRESGREGMQPGDAAPRSSTQRDPVRRSAEELADRANRGFDEMQRRVGPSSGRSEERTIASRQPPDVESDVVAGSWTDAVLDWLHRANRDYQREIAGKLSQAKPAKDGSSPEAAPVPQSTPAALERDGDKAERARARVREKLFAEEEARRKAEREALSNAGEERVAASDAQPAGPTARPTGAMPNPGDPRGRQTADAEVTLSEAELAAERAEAEEWAQRIERRRRAAEVSRLRAEGKAREAAALEAAQRRRDEEEAQRKLAEERKTAEAKRLADEAARRRQEEEAQRKLAEERKTVEAKRLADEAARRRQEEEAQRKLAEERKTAEAKRLVDEAARRRQEEEAQRKLAEERKTAEAKRLADEAVRRRQEEEAQRKLAEERKTAEAKQLAEDAAERRRQNEMQLRLAEERKAAEAKRLAEEAAERRRQDELQLRLAEERKAGEVGGRLADEARRREAALRKQAEERMAADAEKHAREAARRDAAKGPHIAPVEHRGNGEASRSGGGAVGIVEGRRVPDPRIAEGSAERGPVNEAKPSRRLRSGRATAGRHQWPKPTTCRGRKAGVRVKLPGVYLVRRGDTLWGIARRHYGSGTRYPVIYRANRRTIADPDLIFPCQRIHLPKRSRRA